MSNPTFRAYPCRAQHLGLNTIKPIQLKVSKDEGHIGLHSEHKRGITEQIHLRKDTKENMKPNRIIKRFTLEEIYSNVKLNIELLI